MFALILPAFLVVAALLVGPMVLLARISLNQYSPTQLLRLIRGYSSSFACSGSQPGS